MTTLPKMTPAARAELEAWADARDNALTGDEVKARIIAAIEEYSTLQFEMLGVSFQLERSTIKQVLHLIKKVPTR